MRRFWPEVRRTSNPCFKPNGVEHIAAACSWSGHPQDHHRLILMRSCDSAGGPFSTFSVDIARQNVADRDVVNVKSVSPQRRRLSQLGPVHMGSQVPLMLARPDMEAKSPPLSLKTLLIIRNVGSWLFHTKYSQDLCWELGLVFSSTQLLTQVSNLTFKKYCYVGIHVILGIPCDVVSPNFHALNVQDCMDWLKVTWNLELGTSMCELALNMKMRYQSSHDHVFM